MCNWCYTTLGVHFLGVKLFYIVCNICQIMPENEEYNGQLQKIKNIFMPNFAHCHNARRVKAVRSCVLKLRYDLCVLELIFLRIHEGRPLYLSDPVLRPSVLKLYHLMNGTQAKVCLFVAIFKFKVALLDRVTP